MKRNKSQTFQPVFSPPSNPLFSPCLILFFSFFFFTGPLHSETLELTPRALRTGQDIRVEVSSAHIPAERLKSSLSNGHAAEVRYHFRLYRERDGLLSILGDSLEEELSTVFTCMWNPVIERYELHTESETSSYKNYASLLRAISSARIDLDFTHDLQLTRPGSYLLVRVTLIPEMPVPPFNLLAPFITDLRVSSSWERVAEEEER